jgi:hypothetical protein
MDLWERETSPFFCQKMRSRLQILVSWFLGGVYDIKASLYAEYGSSALLRGD